MDEFAQSEMELLFDLSLDLHCVAGLDGYFKHINPAFETVLGFTRDEILSTPILELVHPDDRKATTAAFESLSAGNSILQFENRYIDSVGACKVLQWNAAPDPSTDLIVATARDVTHQRAMQAEVEGARRIFALGNVATSVAHDLRNVLTPIVAMSDYLEGQLPAPSSQVAMALELIQKSAERGIDLVERITLMGSGARLEISEIDLQELIYEVVATLPEAIQTQVVIDTENPKIRGDATQIYRSVLNLCNNACEAMPNGGKLIVSLAEKLLGVTADSVVIQVLDEGLGVPENLRQKIFEPFFSTRRDEGGTGLGLAIVKKIAQQHGGELYLQKVDGKTCFSLELPKTPIAQDQTN